MFRLSALRSGLPLLSSSQQNWIKGILILLVIADHNNYFRLISEDVFRPFTVHVTGFFVLAFSGAFNSKTSLKQFAFERLVRYGWPFIIFYSFYALGSKLTGASSITPLSYSIGLLIGSFELVKQGCGGAFMWFLPALLGFSLVVKVLASASYRSLGFILLVSFLFHVFIAYLPGIFKTYFPLGLGIAIYLIPIVVAFYFLQNIRYFQTLSASASGILFFGGTALLSYIVLVNGRINIEVGALSAPPLERYGLIAANFITNLCALIFIWALALKAADKRGINSALSSVGAHSLSIYLLHPFFFVIAYALISKLGTRIGPDNVWFVGLGAYTVTLVLAWFASKALSRVPRWSSLLFPKDFQQLKEAVLGQPVALRKAP